MSSDLNRMSAELDFEKRMENWSEPEKFIARQVIEINRRCAVCFPHIDAHEATLANLDSKVKLHDSQIKGLKGGKKPALSGTLTSGSIAAAVAAGIIAAWEWLTKRG